METTTKTKLEITFQLHKDGYIYFLASNGSYNIAGIKTLELILQTISKDIHVYFCDVDTDFEVDSSFVVKCGNNTTRIDISTIKNWITGWSDIDDFKKETQKIYNEVKAWYENLPDGEVTMTF